MTQLHFSEKPGPRERQLRRRYQNPLFTDDRRQVSQTQLEQAQREDRQEEMLFAESLKELLERVAKFSPREETEVILGIKEKSDQLYEQCAGLGGDHQREKEGLIRLNEVIMNAIRAASSGDPLAHEELEKEQAAREIHLNLLEYPLVADLLRQDSFIEEDELVPSLLSENAETIRIVMTLFDEDQREALLDQARELLEKLDAENALDDAVRERFQALQALPQ